VDQTALVDDDPPVVRVREFVKRYSKLTAADGVSLDIRRGEIYGLIGPDGAGKSRPYEAIAGVLSSKAAASRFSVKPSTPRLRQRRSRAVSASCRRG